MTPPSALDNKVTYFDKIASERDNYWQILFYLASSGPCVYICESLHSGPTRRPVCRGWECEPRPGRESPAQPECSVVMSVELRPGTRSHLCPVSDQSDTRHHHWQCFKVIWSELKRGGSYNSVIILCDSSNTESPVLETFTVSFKLPKTSSD